MSSMQLEQISSILLEMPAQLISVQDMELLMKTERSEIRIILEPSARIEPFAPNNTATKVNIYGVRPFESDKPVEELITEDEEMRRIIEKIMGEIPIISSIPEKVL